MSPRRAHFCSLHLDYPNAQTTGGWYGEEENLFQETLGKVRTAVWLGLLVLFHREEVPMGGWIKFR